jgi:prevent-host-death family protein
MTETYSTYEAKAKLSEILRKVESGRTIRISRRGQTIAEIRPVANEPTTLAERIIELSEQGVLTAPSTGRGGLKPLARTPGALDRFLSDRNA